MKKLIKILFCFILIASVLCTMPAYANYNAVYEKSLTDSGDNPIYAQIYLLVNLDNDTVIFEKDADKQAAPASLTKIMTATVVLENCKDLDEEVEASYEAIHLLDGTGSSIVGLEPGEKMSIKNLLYCLLVRSGNDAANVLAMHVGGSIEGFVKMMNDKAAALGCKNTHFANVHGLDDPNHYTTARDLMTITKHALTLPYFSEITSTTIYKVPATTDNAGRCVISKGTGNGYNYLCVIMNAPMQNIDDDEPLENCAFVDCRRMFNWVFNHIELKSIASPTQIITEVPLKLSFRTDHISLVPGEEVLALVPTGADAGSVLIEPVPETMPKSVDAPVKKGQEICEARVLYAGEEIARIKLVASEDVSRNVLLFIGATIKKVASSTIFKIIASIVAILVVGYIALFIYENYKRRQRRKLKLVNPGVKGNEYTEKKGRKKK